MTRKPYTPLNPFQSPDVPVDALPVEPLTRAQRRILTIYYDHRERPFVFSELMGRTLITWLPW